MKPPTIPPEIQKAWNATAKQAIPLLTEVLARPGLSESELVYLLSALAGLHGYASLASAIEGLDYGND